MFDFLRRLFRRSSPTPPPVDDPVEEQPDEPTGPQQLKEIESLLERENENRPKPAKPPRGVRLLRGDKPSSIISLDEERWRRSSTPGR
jgi:hypothetical protein